MRSPQGEVSDGLATDWYPKLRELLPGISWLPIPNVGSGVISYLEEWSLNGYLLTGGDDLGVFPHRDETEFAIVDYCVRHRIPLFGICRGMQVVIKRFGGVLTRAPDDRHVAKQHGVSICKTPFSYGGETKIAVNSFHNWTLRKNNLPTEFKVIGCAEDGTVEAAIHEDLPISCIMWHPERPGSYSEFDAAWFGHTFGDS